MPTFAGLLGGRIIRGSAIRKIEVTENDRCNGRKNEARTLHRQPIPQRWREVTIASEKINTKCPFCGCVIIAITTTKIHCYNCDRCAGIFKVQNGMAMRLTKAEMIDVRKNECWTNPPLEKYNKTVAASCWG